MKKKIRYQSLVFSIFALCLLVLLFGKVGATFAASDGLAKEIYVSGTGSDTNDGKSSDKAVGSMEKAYELVTADGNGKIILCGNLAIENVVLPAKKVTITSKTATEDYTSTAVLDLFGYGYNFQAETTIEYITLSTNDYGKGFTCNGFKFTVGDGVTVDSPSGGDFYIIGGRSITAPQQDESGNPIDVKYVEGADVTINSGSCWIVYGAGYTQFGTQFDYLENKGDITINVGGTAEVGSIFAGYKGGNSIDSSRVDEAPDSIPNRFGNVTINVGGNCEINDIYLGSECYNGGITVQYENCTSTLNLVDETAFVGSIYCGGQYAYHVKNTNYPGQYQCLENTVINYYDGTIGDAIYFGGVDIVYNYATGSGPTELIKNATINLYKDGATIHPAVKADFGEGIDDVSSFTVERAQVNIVNDVTFEYSADTIDLSSQGMMLYFPEEPTLKVLGYVNSGSLTQPQVHNTNYNPQAIEFLSFEGNPDLTSVLTNVYQTNANVVYKEVGVDTTTSTIVYVGGEDNPLGTNDENVIPFITATDACYSAGGVLSFKFVSKDGATAWQPSEGTVVFQVPAATTENEKAAYLAMFAMQGMDGFGLDYQEGTYDGKTIGQIIIVAEPSTSEYKVEHYQEQADGTYVLYETEDNLSGTIGEEVTATAKNYDNYVYNAANTNNVASGTVFVPAENEDCLTLKLYYDLKPMKYVLYDSVTGKLVEVTCKYSEVVNLVANEKTGYTFVGWYKGEELVSEDPNYSFTVSDSNDIYSAKYEKNIYDVTATFDIGTGAVTKVTTHVAYQNKATVTAVDEEGYHFIGWYKGEDEVSTDKNYTFTVVESVLLVAKYEKNTYTVTLSSDETCGSASQTNEDGKYLYLDNATVTATEEYGYSFVGWYNGKTLVNKDASYTFVVLDDISLTAKFEKKSYLVTALGDENQGTVSNAQTYVYKTNATVTAEAKTGYHFVAWYLGDLKVSEDASYTFEVEDDTELTATFEKNTYTVTPTYLEACGNVTQTKTNGKYLYLDNATVTAEANTGYTFVGWYDGDTLLSKDASYTFTVMDNTTVTAKFAPNDYTVICVCEENQGVVTEATDYAYQTNATVTAEAKTGYHFVAWYLDNVKVSEDASYTFVVEESVTLTATFEKNTYTVTPTCLEACGSVTQTNTNGKYLYLDNATVTVTENHGYTFTGWYNGDTLLNEDASYTFTVMDDTTLTAKFEKKSYTVSALCDENQGNVSEAQEYGYETNATVTAEAKTGYHFVAWYLGDVKVSEDASYTFEVEDDTELTATFEKNTYTVTPTCLEACGSVSQTNTNGKYLYLDNATVTATENHGYTFVGWYNVNTLLSEDASYTFTVMDDTTVTAKFEKKSYTVSALCDENQGNVSEAQEYVYETNAIVTAEAKNGYHFVAWYLDNVKVSEDRSYTFEVEDDTELTAKFEANMYHVTTIVDALMGQAEGAKDYAFNTTATVNAICNVGYDFVGWYIDGEEISKEINYSFTVLDNVILLAKFEKTLFEITAAFDQGQVTETKITMYAYYGNQAVVKAEQKSGYHFIGWYNGDVKESEELVYKFIATKNVTLNAVFEKDKYTVSDTTIETEYFYLDQATVSVEAKEGYHFLGWFNEEQKVSSELTYQFLVTQSITLEPRFEINAYQVQISCDSTQGTVSGGKEYTYKENATLTATNKEGYAFVGWFNGDVVISLEATYSFEVTENVILVARFATVEKADKEKAKTNILSAAQHKIKDIEGNTDLTEQEKEAYIAEINRITEEAVAAIEEETQNAVITDLKNTAIDKIDDLKVYQAIKQGILNNIQADTDELLQEIQDMNNLSDKDKEAYCSEAENMKNDTVEQINATNDLDEMRNLQNALQKAQKATLDKAETQNKRNNGSFVYVFAILSVATVSFLFLAARFRRKAF